MVLVAEGINHVHCLIAGLSVIHSRRNGRDVLGRSATAVPSRVAANPSPGYLAKVAGTLRTGIVPIRFLVRECTVVVSSVSSGWIFDSDKLAIPVVVECVRRTVGKNNAGQHPICVLSWLVNPYVEPTSGAIIGHGFCKGRLRSLVLSGGGLKQGQKCVIQRDRLRSTAGILVRDVRYVSCCEVRYCNLPA